MLGTLTRIRFSPRRFRQWRYVLLSRRRCVIGGERGGQRVQGEVVDDATYLPSSASTEPMPSSRKRSMKLSPQANATLTGRSSPTRATCPACAR